MKNTCTDQCYKECVYGVIEEIDKANVYIYCSSKDRKYRYGQYVDCDDFRKKEINE